MNADEISGQKLKEARFSDKVVVVTGGGSGIGLQIARDLHAQGASVHILGRNMEKLEKAKGSISPAGSRFYCHQCDISDHQRVRSVFTSIKVTSGRISGLVNNAAINLSRERYTSHRLPRLAGDAQCQPHWSFQLLPGRCGADARSWKGKHSQHGLGGRAKPFQDSNLL
jgi:NAD(P)-dependent dehydrogenase (short-subunit alcohol dehydrogenase family)